jgi:hypothetical protein
MTIKKHFITFIGIIGLLENAAAQTNLSNSTRPNSFLIGAGQAGSTIDISSLKVTDLDSGLIVYSNNFTNQGDATRGLIGYYWPQGGSGTTNYQVNTSMTSVQNRKLRIQSTGFNQNGAGGYNSHAQVIYTNALPRNFYIQVQGQRVQWAGASSINIFRQELTDAKYGLVPGGALTTNRNLALRQDTVHFSGSGNWFNSYGISTNANFNGGAPATNFPGPAGSWTDMQTVGIALSNNVVTFFLNGNKLNSLTNAAWANPTSNIIFDYGYKALSDTNSQRYLTSMVNAKRYSEWQNPPVTYLGPVSNNIPSLINMAFPIPSIARQIVLKANLASFNFNNGGGVGIGSNSLWASRDNTNWTLLLNNSTPSSIDSYKTYSNNIPTNLLGSGMLYLQIRSLVSGAPNTTYTTAQFSRAATNRTDDVFRITAYSAATPISQQISIPTIAPITYAFNQGPIALAGISSSGLPLTYSVVSGPASIIGTNLFPQGAGTIIVQGTQAGSSTFASAQTNFSIVVNKAPQLITTPSISLNGTASSGLGINYEVASGNASLSGNTLRILGSGTIVIRASQPGNANYHPASIVTNILVVPSWR